MKTMMAPKRPAATKRARCVSVTPPPLELLATPSFGPPGPSVVTSFTGCDDVVVVVVVVVTKATVVVAATPVVVTPVAIASQVANDPSANASTMLRMTDKSRPFLLQEFGSFR
jgi:hypothetical protein